MPLSIGDLEVHFIIFHPLEKVTSKIQKEREKTLEDLDDKILRDVFRNVCQTLTNYKVLERAESAIGKHDESWSLRHDSHPNYLVPKIELKIIQHYNNKNNVPSFEELEILVITIHKELELHLGYGIFSKFIIRIDENKTIPEIDEITSK